MRRRRQPESAGRVGTGGSSEEACDPGPEGESDQEGEVEAKA